MCNDYEQHVTHKQYLDAIKALELDSTGSGADMPQADDIRIGDMGPVLRAAGNGVEIVSMRFGWPPPRPKAAPVFNFKSDGRHFDNSKRCLVILSGFFEFVGTKYPKAKYRFALKDSAVMAIAGLWSEAEDGALSFTMLTTAPGPDIEPYHDRQVCVIPPADWAAWLFLTKPQDELLKPLPAGSLEVTLVREGSD